MWDGKRVAHSGMFHYTLGASQMSFREVVNSRMLSILADLQYDFFLEIRWRFRTVI